MKNLKKWISHNFGTASALAVIVTVLIWSYGCESQVKSLLTPNQKVNRAELKLELDTEVGRIQGQLEQLIRTAEIREAELDKQDEIKQKLLEVGLAIAQEGSVNPVGIAFTLAGLLGIGVAVDNRAKDKIIKTQKNNNKGNNGKG